MVVPCPPIRRAGTDSSLTVPPLTFEIHPLPDDSGFRLVGELDLATAPLLQRELQAAEGSGELVLELDELTFMDSSGCSALTNHLRTAGDGTSLVLVNPTPAVTRTLEVSGLAKHPAISIRSDDH